MYPQTSFIHTEFVSGAHYYRVLDVHGEVMNSPRVSSPPTSPSHLHVRKLSTTKEDEAKTNTRKPGRKLVALSGEEDIMSGGPPPVQPPKSRFRNGHASFRLRMLQEQHGTGFEPSERHKLKPQSVPTSPAATGRSENLSPLDSALQSIKMKKVSSKSSSPPATPKSSDHHRDSFKSSLIRRASSERRRATTSAGSDIEEHSENPAVRVVRQFKHAHESFRLRMFQEQHGFEPVVFMTKKRTRDNKSVMSEFKGGDLNKYTAKTYAIQNGNEVFGGDGYMLCNLFKLKEKVRTITISARAESPIHFIKIRQIHEPSAAGSARRPSAFVDPEASVQQNWHTSSNVPGELSTTSQRLSLSAGPSSATPSPYSSLCLSILAATPPTKMINARIAMTVDAPSIRTENIRYFPKKGKEPKKRKSPFSINIQ
ncbi:unnamed protein product [Caenorhabditis bovis]|uniref:Uncharacterized protein n=1 Tax=Caenorhabditis bovis TaxID=2654633 RepID=A0A8S1EK23_9PELO|nr:unnamed protein product [Caenorhabditis bovis]